MGQDVGLGALWYVTHWTLARLVLPSHPEGWSSLSGLVCGFCLCCLLCVP